MHDPSAVTISSLPGMRSLPAGAWDRLWHHPIGSSAFCRVCEAAQTGPFDLAGFGVWEDDRLLAAVPAFRHDYRLDMPLGPTVHRIGDWLAAHYPRLVTVPVLSLGSPYADQCALAMDDALTAGARIALMRQLLHHMRDEARATGGEFLAIKDLDDKAMQAFDSTLREEGFTRAPSLPVAVLDLPYRTMDDYLASLSQSMRADLRRKERQAAHVRFEEVRDVEPIESDLHAIYEATRDRKQASYDVFNALPLHYFSRIAAEMPDAAHLVVARADGELAGFNLFFADDRRAVASRIGQKQPLGRACNLYFMNWLWMVGWCIERKVPRLELGQTSYPLKLRLGCRLERRWVYFRHVSGAINRIVRWAGPLAAFDAMEDGTSLTPSTAKLSAKR